MFFFLNSHIPFSSEPRSAAEPGESFLFTPASTFPSFHSFIKHFPPDTCVHQIIILLTCQPAVCVWHDVITMQYGLNMVRKSLINNKWTIWMFVNTWPETSYESHTFTHLYMSMAHLLALRVVTLTSIFGCVSICSLDIHDRGGVIHFYACLIQNWISP